ncbi:1-phosphatidylinositol phosphodiesterase [Amia ocellicauda]|uniref:1-phosphatidylinositol phosphodiesterase n=1 Tax=Amia ocellicauda TaxID=2972642 RepID=UPI00346412AA
MRTIPALHSPLKPPLCLCLLLVIFILGCHGVGEFSFNDNKSKPVSNNNADWMARLNDNMLLSDVLIPGTHDTMALHGGPLAKCQAWKLEDQLKAGVRYLDLRVFNFFSSDAGKLFIVHGIIYQHKRFEDVVNKVNDFLKQHPQETVLMRVKPEHFKKGKVNDLLDDYMNKKKISVWVNKEIPKMNQVRGKIVFLQKEPFTLGIPLTSTDQQNDYVVKKIEDKKNKIKDHINEAAEGRCSEKVYLIYSSGTGKCKNFKTPKTIAREINPWLTQHLDKIPSEEHKCVGVIAMDFPGEELISRIINLNFIGNQN